LALKSDRDNGLHSGDKNILRNVEERQRFSLACLIHKNINLKLEVFPWESRDKELISISYIPWWSYPAGITLMEAPSIDTKIKSAYIGIQNQALRFLIHHTVPTP